MSLTKKARSGADASPIEGCGALQKCLIELKAEGYTKNCKTPGVHNPLDPEYSILKQRLARRVRYEGLQPSHMDLVTMTQVAERTITNVSA
ncbi:LCIB_C_CA domain-containing protein [Haematococcus lacustris]|uniref:LCIB_C_CA domain-containing protein n=1 Tax=Haematococcus lacustris TaxID=44745 RepID=A0A699Z2L4_HAELA|nr:LCIB_C_CA domain-containing protein [Haematococcus lacustris]